MPIAPPDGRNGAAAEFCEVGGRMFTKLIGLPNASPEERGSIISAILEDLDTMDGVASSTIRPFLAVFRFYTEDYLAAGPGEMPWATINSFIERPSGSLEPWQAADVVRSINTMSMWCDSQAVGT